MRAEYLGWVGILEKLLAFMTVCLSMDPFAQLIVLKDQFLVLLYWVSAWAWVLRLRAEYFRWVRMLSKQLEFRVVRLSMNPFAQLMGSFPRLALLGEWRGIAFWSVC